MAFDRYCECLSVADKREVDGEMVEVRTTCGTPVFKKRRFTMGHDAKLKSVILRAFRAGEAIHYVVPGDDTVHAITVRALADKYNWGKILVDKATPPSKQRVKYATPEDEANARAAEARGAEVVEEVLGFRPCRVKVGRWWYDGQVVNFLPNGNITVEYQVKGGERKLTTVAPDKVEQD